MDNPFKKSNRRPEPILIPDSSSIDDPTGKMIIRTRQPKIDERVLGWAKSIDEATGKEVRQLTGISMQDRDSTHFYIVGASGTGKTKFLEYLMIQDWESKTGFGVIDPHGDLVDDLKNRMLVAKGKEFLEKWVVLIDPTDKGRTVSFNPLERIEGVLPAAIAEELTDAFKKIWADSWGARMEALLKNSLIALIENNLTLAELPLFLSSSRFRREKLEQVEHPICRQYFERFNSLRPNVQDEWAESTMNKITSLLNNDYVRQMFISPKSSFNLRDIMDSGKILLVKLDRGQLKGSGDLLGSLMLAKIQMAAFTRTDTPYEERRPFYLYIDEFQNFATESFLNVLAESRKYRLPLTLAHQHLSQLPNSLRASILTNCRLQAYFQISRDDANILAKESLASIYNDPPGWEWYVQQLQELPNRGFVMKNKIKGGVVALRTAELRKLEDVLQETKDLGVEKNLGTMESIGKESLRNRKEIEDGYKARRDELTKANESGSFREPKRLS